MQTRMLVDGAWRDAASGRTYTATSPVTGEPIGAIPQGDRSDASEGMADEQHPNDHAEHAEHR